MAQRNPLDGGGGGDGDDDTDTGGTTSPVGGRTPPSDDTESDEPDTGGETSPVGGRTPPSDAEEPDQDAADDETQPDPQPAPPATQLGDGRQRPADPTTADDDTQAPPPTDATETDTRQTRRQDYAQRFDRFGPGDVAFRRRSGRVSPYIPETTVRERLREDVAGQSPAVDPGDVEIEETERGTFEASVPDADELVDEYASEQAAEDSMFEPGDFTVGLPGTDTSPVGGVAPPTGARSVELTETAQREFAREQFAAEIEGVDAEDVSVSETVGGFRLAGVDTGPGETVSVQGERTVAYEDIVAEEQPGDAVGQTTDPTYDPADAPGGFAETVAGGVEATLTDPTGVAEEQFGAIPGDIATASAEAAGGETVERVADVETFIPQSAVEGFQEAGAFVARGESDEEIEPDGSLRNRVGSEFQDLGGLQGIGERAADVGIEASGAPARYGLEAAETIGVPGAERAGQAVETAEERVAEPATAGITADLPATIAEAPGGIGALAVRAEQSGRVIAEDPGTAPEIGTAAAGYAGLAGVTAAQGFAESPFRSTGRVVGEVAAGAAVVRTVERGADVARGARVRARADDTVDFEDITSERGAGGELPQFETSPDAPTSRAVGEVRRRAADTPEGVESAVGTERVLYHSTRADLGRRTEVGEGRSELPGMFTSPDASPLALSEGASTSGVRVGAPRLFGEGERLAAFPGRRIERMPESALGAGYEVRVAGEAVERGMSRRAARNLAGEVDDPNLPDAIPGAERRPRTDTPGYQFLTEQADPATGYVRPTGSRTPELEAVLAPGTEIERAGRLAVRTGGTELPLPGDRSVRLGGRTIPMDVYRYADEPDAGDAADVADDVGTVATREVAEEFAESRRRARTREQTPVGGPLFTPTRTEPTRTTARTTAPGTTSAFGTERTTGFDTEGTATTPTETSVFGEPTTGTFTSTTDTPSGTPRSPPPSTGTPTGGSGRSPPPTTGTPPTTPGLTEPDFDGEPERYDFEEYGGTAEERTAEFVDPFTGEY